MAARSATPTLHDLSVEVPRPTRAAALRRRTLRTGLAPGPLRSWIASVNGERLFLKGSNHGPTRMAIAEATPDELGATCELAVDAGLDLLRIHAPSPGPSSTTPPTRPACSSGRTCRSSGATPAGVRKQAVRQAGGRPARPPPLDVVWCGHNEPMAIDTTRSVGDPKALRRMASGRSSAQRLPHVEQDGARPVGEAALEKADGTRPVIAHSGVLPHLPQLDGTDTHLYFGWYHGDERDLPGLLAAAPHGPLRHRVRRPGGPRHRRLLRARALARPRLGAPRRTTAAEARFDQHVPPADFATFDEWRGDAAYQALVIERHIEALRRIKYRPTGGFAQFCFADGRPAGDVVGARPRAAAQAGLRGAARGLPAGDRRRRPPPEPVAAGRRSPSTCTS